MNKSNGVTIETVHTQNISRKIISKSQYSDGKTTIFNDGSFLVGNRGITLIALIITIIVLLILAGVTINVVVNGGIFKQAQKAAEETKIAQEKEILTLLMVDFKIGKIEYTKTKLEQKIGSQLKNYTVSESGGICTVTIDDERIYILEKGKEIQCVDYVIKTESELKNFRDDVNAGNSYEDKVVYLANDITLNNSEEWVPIGNTPDSDYPAFSGVFNGGGHQVDGIYITAGGPRTGFFGTIVGGEIRNLTIGANSYIHGSVNVGGVCGAAVLQSVLDRVHNYATVTGSGGYTRRRCWFSRSWIFRFSLF